MGIVRQIELISNVFLFSESKLKENTRNALIWKATTCAEFFKQKSSFECYRKYISFNFNELEVELNIWNGYFFVKLKIEPFFWEIENFEKRLHSCRNFLKIWFISNRRTFLLIIQFNKLIKVFDSTQLFKAKRIEFSKFC